MKSLAPPPMFRLPICRNSFGRLGRVCVLGGRGCTTIIARPRPLPRIITRSDALPGSSQAGTRNALKVATIIRRCAHSTGGGG